MPNAASEPTPFVNLAALAPERLVSQLRFLAEIDKVKSVFRNSLLTDSSRHENDAEHSWHMAIAVSVLSEYFREESLGAASRSAVDVAHAMVLALFHDVVEIDAGDVYAYAVYDPAEKLDKEVRAAERIFGLLPPDQAPVFRALWEEFEYARTPEARLARSLDRLMPMLHNYLTEGRQWLKHGIRAAQVLERNREIAASCPELWRFVESLVADAVARGYLGG